jgi:hypothetical protein
MKYNVGDYVRTKYGAGEIKKIWLLNDNITVFEVYLLRQHAMKTLFYGELDSKVEFVYRTRIENQVK